MSCRCNRDLEGPRRSTGFGRSRPLYGDRHVIYGPRRSRCRVSENVLQAADAQTIEERPRDVRGRALARSGAGARAAGGTVAGRPARGRGRRVSVISSFYRRFSFVAHLGTVICSSRATTPLCTLMPWPSLRPARPLPSSPRRSRGWPPGSRRARTRCDPLARPRAPTASARAQHYR